jgi:Fe2+ transport system protein FeoA
LEEGTEPEQDIRVNVAMTREMEARLRKMGFIEKQLIGEVSKYNHFFIYL